MLGILNRIRISSSGWACFLLAFALVCVKKWEPGGNLDSIWYSAVSRNVALSGDFHHFMVSPYFMPTVSDHMPLTYWIEGFAMSKLGISDFTARLYPMLCSVLTYVFVYLIGCEIGLSGPDERASSEGRERGRLLSADTQASSRHYGLSALIAFLFAYGASKWNGTLMLDVPLTMYFTGAAFFFIRGLRTNQFWLAAPFLVLGIMTKGPIIGAVPLAILVWIFCERQWSLLKRGSLWMAVLALIAGLAFFCLPSFHLEGMNPFLYFFEHKKSYLQQDSGGWLRYFAYLEVLWTNGAPLLLLFFYAAVRLLKGPASHERSLLRLCALIAICTVVPLSFFQVKFPHYMLPVYPFMALASSGVVASWLQRWREKLPMILSRLAIIGVFVLAFLPVQTSGGRSKETLNIVNILKLQTPAARVGFLGTWSDDMAIFQAFKWWGGLNLEGIFENGHAANEEVGHHSEAVDRPVFDLTHDFLLVSRSRLPVTFMNAQFDARDCILLNEVYCVLSKAPLHLELPVSKFPHQVYVPEDFQK